RTVGATLGWLAILAAGVTYNKNTSFPGYMALVPVGGTLLVIWAGTAGSPRPLSRLIDGRPTQFVGDISYSLYLWHWPLIVVAPYALHTALDLAQPVRVGILLVSLLVAWAT